ncbi:MAG: DUF2382 domain-containing protein [Sulfurifustis sp.]
MTKIVVGLFENMESAQRAMQALEAEGFARENIELRSGDQVVRQMQSDTGESGDGIWASIKRFFSGGSTESRTAGTEWRGMSESEALLAVHADDATAEDAAELMDEHGAVDLEERLGGGVTGAGTEQTIPIVEEEVKVGKREVSRGGVRLRSRIIERPVEEEVSLRDEKVEVERRPVDRPASTAGDAAFEEKTFEVRETSEEPVVQKRARVKEEVSVKKSARQRTEKVRETVRGTSVEIEELSPEEQREFATYESDFRNDWQAKYASRTGLKYADVMPGYQYGYRLGRNEQYRGAEWSEIEPQVRRDWDQRGYGPWEHFKDAVRSGWERARH